MSNKDKFINNNNNNNNDSNDNNKNNSNNNNNNNNTVKTECDEPVYPEKLCMSEVSKNTAFTCKNQRILT